MINALGVIPARGGSKGIPGKNLRQVAGIPLIGHTIEAARRSARLSGFAVTTDDRAIQAFAESMRCPVIQRPGLLAQDDTPMVPVVRHALEALDRQFGCEFDVVVVLQPTAPMRRADDIDQALEMLAESDVDSVVSVVRVVDHHPARMYRVLEGWLVPYDVEPEARLRQHLPPLFLRNGAVYVCRREILLGMNSLIGPRARPYEMPSERSVNIDEELDLVIADLLMRRLAAARP